MFGPTLVVAVVCGVGAVAAPFVTIGRARMRRRGKRRNAADACAHCGESWEASDTGGVDAHIVEGQLVCAQCAPGLRKRTIASVAGLTVIGSALLVLGWSPIIQTLFQYGFVDGFVGLTRWAWILLGLPPLIFAASVDWSLRAMRKDNVLALEALARARLFGGAGVPIPALREPDMDERSRMTRRVSS
jgi:hypothetical protein